MANRNNGGSPWWANGILILAGSCLIGILAAPGASAQSVEIHQLFPQLDESAWRDFAEGRLANRREFVSDVVSRLDNIPDSLWRQGLQRIDTELAVAIDSPLEFAGQPFRYSGYVVATAPIHPEFGDGSGGDIWNTLIKTDGGLELEVLTPVVPRAWRHESPAGQAVAGHGLLLTMRKSLPVLASPRLNWYPRESGSDLNIANGVLILGRAGFDAGLLDDARNYSDAAMTPDEYRLLDGMTRAVLRIAEKPGEFPLPGDRPRVDLVAVARNPAALAGELFDVAGELRRITPVRTDPAPAASNSGDDDHWYHLDVFLPLGNRQVILPGDNGQQPLRVNGSFGITLLMPDLADDLRQASLPVKIQVPAFFLKTWEHKTLASRQAGGDIRKPNPVFVGIPGQLRMSVRPGTGEAASMSWLVPLFWVGLVVLLTTLLVWTRSRHPSWHTRQRQRRHQVDPGIPGEPE